MTTQTNNHMNNTTIKRPRFYKGTWLLYQTIFLVLTVPSYAQEIHDESNHIKYYPGNPHYWQYKGQPVLLLGATNNDNLFQSENMVEELDNMKEAGGNYIRNTMSSRDRGDVQPFLQLPDGKYDLNQWEPDYWQKLERLLKETYERDITVQIELWDPHDIYGNGWERHYWNPDNNINYGVDGVTLKSAYGEDAMTNIHDFFYTVPALHDDQVVLYHQRRFVEKVLSYTLDYPNVLYCITNEIHPNTLPEWGWYWSRFIKAYAYLKGRTPLVTEMFWDPEMRGMPHRAVLDRPDMYDYFEASQNSSSVHGRHNWEKSVWLYEQMERNGIQPINHVKIYGIHEAPDGPEDHDALARFWRNILAGAASSRFHRPGGGVGLTERTAKHLTSARMLMAEHNIFGAAPDMHHSLLSNRLNNEAFCNYIDGESYIVYFPYGGDVSLDLSKQPGRFLVKWLQADTAKFISTTEITGGQTIDLACPVGQHTIVLVKKMQD